MSSRKVIRELAVFLIVSLAAAPASSEPVSVTGGFTSFTANIFGDTGGEYTLLNGSRVCPDSGCSTFVGQTIVNFPGTQSTVTYQNFTFPTLNPLNEVKFTPALAQEVGGTGPTNQFFLGTLEFTNGIWSSLQTLLTFVLTTHASAPALNNKILTDTLIVVSTPNNFTTGTPAQNADLAYFSGTPAIGSLRAYELQDTPTRTNHASVKVYGYIDSLHLSEFSDVSGGFIDPGVDLAPTPGGVAAPDTIALLSLGLCALGFARRRLDQPETACMPRSARNAFSIVPV